MPQPATHYLVTRFAIPKEHYSTWWDRYKEYFGLGSCAPDLFYFPKLPIANTDIRNDLSWADMANPLHSNNSYDMFCNLLDLAKQNKLNHDDSIGKENANRQFSFTFGYYCHVVTDCIFHPYVYRSTGDYWHTSNEAIEMLHKKQELYIDSELYERYYSKEKNLDRIKVDCNETDSKLLDFSIANFFNTVLLKTYPDCLPQFDNESPTNELHPIQQAYKALINSIPLLFEGKKIFLWGSNVSFNINLSEIADIFKDDFFTSPYKDCPSLPQYSPNDLFLFSVVECYKVFSELIKFWNSNETNSKIFFESNYTNYLNSGNFNLDTGLPAHLNNCKPLRKKDHEHYNFMSKTLSDNYKYFENDYLNFDKSILRNKQLLK